MMSRFPKLTETFVLDEMLELERQGVTLDVYPLWREAADVVHPEAVPLVDRARFQPTFAVAHLRSVWFWLRNRPGRLLRALAVLLCSNLGSPRYWLGAVAIIPKALTFARAMQADGVQHLHAHFASHPAAAAYLVGALTGIPWSFTAHGSDLHRDQTMLKKKVEAAELVVAISEYNRAFIEAHVGPAAAAKVKVLHCGVRLSEFTASRPELGDGLHIVCTGTLHEVKGQRYLLEACARLRRDRWHCHLIGDGPDSASLQRLADDLGIRDRVTFHGQLARERVRCLLATMNVACAPSVPTDDGRREGIPVALMEAAACGLPLIASRLSGIPELVAHEETGILVRPRDVAGLTAALRRLADEPETRSRLGAAARCRLRDGFDLQSNVARLKDLMLDGGAQCSS